MDSRFVNVIESCNPASNRKFINLPFNAETKQESNEIESKLQNISGMYGSAQKSRSGTIIKKYGYKTKDA